MKIFGGVQSALCRAKLISNDPLRKIPTKEVRHKNIPTTRTVVQSSGVGRRQNNGSLGDRSVSVLVELLNDILNESCSHGLDMFLCLSLMTYFIYASIMH
jgi:hypothetical protein